MFGLCVVMTVQMNRLLVHTRTLQVENEWLEKRVEQQQEAMVLQMEQRLALIRRNLAKSSPANAPISTARGHRPVRER